MVTLSEESQTMLQNSQHVDELSAIVDWIAEKTNNANLQLTDLQWTILINHLNEMISRSKTGELLPGIDISLFSEVSADSLDLAQQIVKRVGNLPTEESYLLSIHFESAKNN